MIIQIKSLKVDKGNLIIEPVPTSKHLVYSIVDEVKRSSKIYIADIDIKKNKRSLNSNNYAWLKITEIADLLRRSKEEIYLEMLKEYGQSQMISVVAEGEEMLKKCVKYCEEAGESVLNGKTFKHLKVYAGSSEFDSREMSIFISGIVDECKSLDIETLTPEQLNLMNSKWGK